ncbi:MAG: DNA alkylation repair protein [Candidatus Kariarchaeaceae archaeon]
MSFSALLREIRENTLIDQNPLSKIKNLQSAKEGKTRLKVVGMSNPLVKKISKKLFLQTIKLDIVDILDDVTDTLENNEIYEDQILAIYTLEKMNKKFPDNIFDYFDGWIDFVDYWAISDHLIINIAPYIDPKSYLDRISKWRESDNFWRRRMSITFFLKHVREASTHYNQVLETTQYLINDKSYYVRKAFPWIIRDATRKNPDVHEVLFNFLSKNIVKISKTELRESMKYLNDDLKKQLLKKYLHLKN